MIKRTIDISEPAYLHLKNQQLLIERDSEVIGSVPVEDLGVLILEHPAIVITQAAILACQKNNVAVVFCDERHLPYSVLLPLSEGHTLHNRILQEQIAVTGSTQKRIWKHIVQEKISQQIQTLEEFGIESTVLKRLHGKVKAGDSENHEAQAAQRYWPLLMGKDFRRNPDKEGVNSILNYGYSIVRGLVARALVSGGLHPSIGIHHHNQYNGLALADDVMEPFRPWVDRKVRLLVDTGDEIQIDRETKGELLGLLSTTVKFKTKDMPFMVASHRLVADLKRAMVDKSERLHYPQLKR